jgi:Na+-translocating ferredoxin:NAD+ oxidoreductase RnfG subunit
VKELERRFVVAHSRDSEVRTYRLERHDESPDVRGLGAVTNIQILGHIRHTEGDRGNSPNDNHLHLVLPESLQ